ncbi:MAG TPA: hypothetical protein PK333_04190, partial [Candidatus Moranbacteria bacterium]|nr:hypothetical protein [Candidatus Moranbacteria bacterium]
NSDIGFQTVFINVSFLYLGQISHVLPTGHITIINSKCPTPKFIISDLITFYSFHFALNEVGLQQISENTRWVY